MTVESCIIDWIRRQSENDTLEMKNSFSTCQNYTKKLVVRDSRQLVQWAEYRRRRMKGSWLLKLHENDNVSLSLWHLIRSFENDLSWICRVSNRYSSFWSHWFSHLRVYRIRSWWMNAIKLSRRLTIKDGEYIQILNVAIGIFEIIVCRTETLNQWSNSSYDLDIISLSSNLIIFERKRTNSLWFVYRTWHSIPDQISEKNLEKSYDESNTTIQ